MIPDNYDRWEAHDDEKEMELQKLPVCCYCEERIQQDTFFLINDEIICEDCMDSYFRKAVDDFAS